ncbi:paired box protein Pax-6-like [Branchiostoma lanceolatum]|uniref:paired box protein Pax-6-like n=1 Tax=Branchiostoma lanceolatum TaxID=7740 RepID=UPI003451F3EA
MATACVQDLPPFSPLVDEGETENQCPDNNATKPAESGAKKGAKRRDRSKRSTGDVAGRRLRINFSAQQLSTLEAMFAQNRYPDADTRDRLAQSLGVAESRVIVWFQNKRARSRRQDKGRVVQPTPSNPPAYPPIDKSPDQTYSYPEPYSQSQCPTMYASCALQRPKTVHHFPSANPSCNLPAAPSQSRHWASSRPTSDVTATTWSTLTVSSAGRFYDCQPTMSATQFRGKPLPSALLDIEENGSDDEVKDFGAMHDESRARISIPSLSQGPRIRAPFTALSTLNFGTVKELAIQCPRPSGAGPYSPISEPDDSLPTMEALLRPGSVPSTPTSELSEPLDFASLPSPASLVDMYDVVDELKDFLTQYPLF